MDILESRFLSSSLGLSLDFNIADKVAVRGQNNSKAPYDFATYHYYIFKDKHDTTCINNSISHRNIKSPHTLSTSPKLYKITCNQFGIPQL